MLRTKLWGGAKTKEMETERKLSFIVHQGKWGRGRGWEWIDYFDAMRWLKKTFLFTISPNKRNMRDNRSDSFFWWGLDHSRMMTMSIMQMRIFTLSRSAFQWILAGAQENILQLKSRGGWRVERKRKGRADERVSRKNVSEEGGREEMNSWQGQR